MADKNKPDITDENAETELDDKSINELLKEYADDVKDKDLDDFLQDAPEDDDDDDAFDNDDALMEGAPVKKRSSVLGLFIVLLLCGAAGAGAWMYLNRDDGMTNVMGGFQGDTALNDDYIASPVREPIVPESDPAMPDFVADIPASPQPILGQTGSLDNMLADDLPPPMPISNEMDQGQTITLDDITPAPSAPEQAPVQVQAEVTPQESIEAPASTQIAVQEWLSASDDDMTQVEEKLPPVTETPLAEIPVAEINARPVSNAEAAKTRTPATRSAPRPSQASSASPADDALPPPYLAIQARRSGAPASTTAPVASPVLEDDPQQYIRGSTAHTEPSTTRATGIYRDLVSRGGGEIGLGTTVIQPDNTQDYMTEPPSAPVYERPVAAPAPAAPLAISGGRSLPEGRTMQTGPNTSASVQLPSAISGPAAHQQVNAPAAATHTAPTQTAHHTAAILLRDAQAAEAAGQLDQAVHLYQRALEADAIYGDGRSIDRGMVYDRIGAIRTRR